MNIISPSCSVERYLLKDDGRFPNNNGLPVLVYRNALNVPVIFPAPRIKALLKKNGWSNAWKSGVSTVHHYHSVTHELLACYKGRTRLLLGGESGVTLEFGAGDLILIPAGVAYKNLHRENNVTCIEAYPDGLSYDMKFGSEKERPWSDMAIRKVPLPSYDPIYGADGMIRDYWKQTG